MFLCIYICSVQLSQGQLLETGEKAMEQRVK